MAAVNEMPPRSGAVALVEGIVNTLAQSRLKSAIAILIVAFACFLPGIGTLAPLDRDESQSIVATTRMLQSGNFAEPRLAEEPPRYLPIGIFWLEAAAVRLAGQSLASYRLPSLIGAVATALLTWWVALAFGRPRAALLAGMLMAASFMLASEARVARADAMFAATVTLSLGALARVWLQPDERPDYVQAFLFWSGLGIGILLKGPIGPVAIGLSIAVLVIERGGGRWLARLVPMWGAIWATLLVLPWIVALLVAWAAPPFPARASGATLLLQYSFNIPPGSHILAFGATFWPSALFAALAIPFVLDNARQRSVFFCLAWALPGWALAELIPGKLPHFILGACPAIAILAATAIDNGAVIRKGWVAGLLRLSLFLLPLVVGGRLVAELMRENSPFAAVAMVVFGASVVIAAIAWRWLDSGASPVGATALSVIAALVFYYGAFGLVVPNLVSLHTAERIVAAANAVMKCPDPKYAATGFREPSLVLAGGSSVTIADAAGAADFIAAGGCRAALVEMGQQSSFGQRIEDLGLNVEVRGDVGGLNVGTLRYVSVRIVTLKGAE